MSTESLGRYRKLYAAGVIEGRRINSVPLDAEAWLWRLTLIADDLGNLPADERILTGRAAPLRNITTASATRMTDSLVAAGLVCRYTVDGEEYLHVVDFERFQAVSNGKRVRRYPENPNGSNPNQSKPIQTNPDLSSPPESGIRSPDSGVRMPDTGAAPIHRDPDGPSFLAFWFAYPPAKRIKQGDCLALWSAFAREGIRPEAIVNGAVEYAASPVGQSKFCLSAPKWLEGRCWLDDRAAWCEQSDEPKKRKRRTYAEITGEVADGT